LIETFADQVENIVVVEERPISWKTDRTASRRRALHGKSAFPSRKVFPGDARHPFHARFNSSSCRVAARLITELALTQAEN